ncbi:MAG TPA: hypothetical protein VH561_18210 [Micromonosporaceae bacterium]|jgi:hypothetical protein
MTHHPGKDEIAAALQAMTDESGLWQRQSDRLDALLITLTGAEITDFPKTFIFDGLLAQYNAVAEDYKSICVDGRDATGAIATALTAVAGVYDDEERRNLHAILDLY